MGAQRSGPFWDGVEGRAPLPPAAATLGLQILEVDPDRGTIELAFEAKQEWTNPVGNVLGAFVAAMLYDTVGPAVLATLQPDQFQSTHDMTVHFLRPVRPGPLSSRSLREQKQKRPNPRSVWCFCVCSRAGLAAEAAGSEQRLQIAHQRRRRRDAQRLVEFERGDAIAADQPQMHL